MSTKKVDVRASTKWRYNPPGEEPKVRYWLFTHGYVDAPLHSMSYFPTAQAAADFARSIGWEVVHQDV